MRRVLLCSLVVVAVIAAGCGSGTDEVVPDENGDVVLDFSEFSFGADVVKVKAGQTVTFVLDNGGEKEHEFMVGRNVVESDEGYANGFEHDFFEGLMPMVDPPSAAMDMDMDHDMEGMKMEGMDHDMEGMDHDMEGMEMEAMDHHGFMVTRLPGETARVTVTIPADAVGEWEIGCFQDKGVHWDSGMRAILVVTA